MVNNVTKEDHLQNYENCGIVPIIFDLFVSFNMFSQCVCLSSWMDAGFPRNCIIFFFDVTLWFSCSERSTQSWVFCIFEDPSNVQQEQNNRWSFLVEGELLKIFWTHSIVKYRPSWPDVHTENLVFRPSVSIRYSHSRHRPKHYAGRGYLLSRKSRSTLCACLGKTDKPSKEVFRVWQCNRLEW